MVWSPAVTGDQGNRGVAGCTKVGQPEVAAVILDWADGRGCLDDERTINGRSRFRRVATRFERLAATQVTYLVM